MLLNDYSSAVKTHLIFNIVKQMDLGLQALLKVSLHE